MKRPIFLIIGAVTVFILVGVWLYVLLYGNPENLRESFTNFETGEPSDTTFIPEPVRDPEPTVEVTSDEQLRQLTTEPVVGFMMTQATPSSTPQYTYIEAGTGHIFTIDSKSGEVRRISKTTIPNAQAGVITPNGQHVMVISGSGSKREVLIGRMSSSSDTLLTVALDEPVSDIHATFDNTILYSVPAANTLTAKEYDPVTNTTKTLFTVPFREAQIAWGAHTDNSHYVYPKATRLAEGYVYEVVDSALQRLPVSGYGLSAVGSDSSVLYAHNDLQVYKTAAYTTETPTTTTVQVPIALIPEKCVAFYEVPTSFLCGANTAGKSTHLPDSWYQGTEQFADKIWFVTTKGSSAQLLTTPENETGRTIDILHPRLSQNDTTLLFQNKTDRTLWLYSVLPNN